MSLKFASLALILTFTSTFAYHDEIEGGIKRGRCPYVIPLQKSISQHKGLWFNTHASFFNTVSCSYAFVKYKGTDVEIYRRASTISGKVISDKILQKSVHDILGLHKFVVEISGKYKIPVVNAIVAGEPNSIMVWGCAMLPENKHFEYALLYSRSGEISNKSVRKYRKYLKNHGSSVTKFYRTPSVNCPSLGSGRTVEQIERADKES